MKTIVTEFGKLKYNHLPTGMRASGDTIEDKAYELLVDIKVIKTYIYDILVLRK